MVVTTGKVVDGKVVVADVPIEDGTEVTILAPDQEQMFALSAEEEAVVRRGLDDIRAGRVISGEELRRRLARP